MTQCDNLGSLFLVEAGCNYEPLRLMFTCTSFEFAVSCAEGHMADDDRSCYDDLVRIRAIEPGPGEGVVVARWLPERAAYGIWPTVVGPDGWEVPAEGPPSADPTRWERVL